MHGTDMSHTNSARLSFLAGLAIGGIVTATSVISAIRLLSASRRKPGHIVSAPFAYRFDSARLVSIDTSDLDEEWKKYSTVLVVDFSLENLSNDSPLKSDAYERLSASQDGKRLGIGRMYRPISSRHRQLVALNRMQPHAIERVFAVIYIENEMSPVYLAVHREPIPHTNDMSSVLVPPAVSTITIYPQTVRLANNGNGISPLG